MRISDWSSDVRSSDLEGQSRRNVFQLEPAGVVRVLRPADHLTTARPRHESHAMPRFLIERDITDAGAMTPEQLAEATQHSNAVLAAMDTNRKSTRLNSSHTCAYRMQSSA